MDVIINQEKETGPEILGIKKKISYINSTNGEIQYCKRKIWKS